MVDLKKNVCCAFMRILLPRISTANNALYNVYLVYNLEKLSSLTELSWHTY